MTMKAVKVAVVGVGYFGSLHVQKYAEVAGCDLVAACDIDEKTAKSVAARYNTDSVLDYRNLFGRVDAVSIAVPTCLHYLIAKDFLARGVHVLLEKPMCKTLEEADELFEISNGRNVVLQVGHLERFNPAVNGANPYLTNPRFIESRRISPFQKRTAATNVVLDMMIHDLDLIFSMVDSPFEEIEAFGVSVLSEVEDIANARIKFANGCVATLTASRTSSAAERTINVFQNHSFVAIDLIANKFSVTNRVNGTAAGAAPQIKKEERVFGVGGVLKSEIVSFLEAVRTGYEPVVTAGEARKALEAALIINRKLEPAMRLSVA